MKLRIIEEFWGINRRTGERTTKITDNRSFEPIVGSVLEFPIGKRRFSIDAVDEENITVTVQYENASSNKTFEIEAGDAKFYRPRSMDGGYQYHIIYGNNVKRIIELIKEIEGRKEHENAATTYKDIPALREIDEILQTQFLAEKPYERDALADSIFAVRYLATSYENMWRIAYAVEFYNLLLKLQNELYCSFNEIDKECSDDYYRALRARNYYQKDSCDDLKSLVKELLPEATRARIEKEVLVDLHPIKHDPVELTEEYLSVIDEVERIMDTEEVKRMHPFEKSDLFEQLLKERGVKWIPITVLNPNIRFN